MSRASSWSSSEKGNLTYRALYLGPNYLIMTPLNTMTLDIKSDTNFGVKTFSLHHRRTTCYLEVFSTIY